MSQRDGSLIRRKQEQWAREREEKEREAWFPFGRPGCGSPNRKFTSKSHQDPSSSGQGSSQPSYSQMYNDEDLRHERRYHKKSSSRHRSRSRSDERYSNRSDERHGSHSRDYHQGGSSIHVNPRFGAPPSASYILQENQRYEAANAALRSQVFQAENRIAALESQLGSIGGLRQELSEAREDVARQRIVNQTLESNLRSATMRNNNLDRTLGTARSELSSAQREVAVLKEHLRASEANVQLKQDSMTVLLQRNEVVVKKCEELVEKVRAITAERDESLHNLGKTQQELQDYQRALQIKAEELRRVEEELATAREKDRMWTMEKTAYERVIREKEAAMARMKTANTQKSTVAKGREGYDSLMRVVKAMREEYDAQISQLTARLDVSEELDTTLEGGEEEEDESVLLVDEFLNESTNNNV